MISLGLTGFPLGHSLSPSIHEAALVYSGLEGEYSLYPISPQDDRGLENLIGRVRKGEIKGLNVTIPFKQKIMPLLDVLSPAVEAIGAVNTVYINDGKLTGENTDAPAFLNDLKCLIGTRETEQIQAKKALVLGAGGAARAVVYALLKDGWQVTVAARREVQAKELITQFSGFSKNLLTTDFTAAAIQMIAHEMALIVNTTPVGMFPEIDANPWPQEIALPETAVCYDLVYNPRQTRFVTQAKRIGLRADSGLGMLVRQAALAFEIWTGKSVPVEHLLSIVEAL